MAWLYILEENAGNVHCCFSIMWGTISKLARDLLASMIRLPAHLATRCQRVLPTAIGLTHPPDFSKAMREGPNKNGQMKGEVLSSRTRLMKAVRTLSRRGPPPTPSMANQLAKFTLNMAETTKPLHDLLSKKDVWTWEDSQQQAYSV